MAAATAEHHAMLLSPPRAVPGSIVQSESPSRYHFPQWGSLIAPHPQKGQLSLLTQHDSLVVENETIQKRGSVLSTEFLSNSLTEYRTAKKVYILTSFIEAHEYAQKKISHFVGDLSGTFNSNKVTAIFESSREQVRQARVKLSEIDSNAITLQVSKQTARWILHVQEDMVAEFQREGVLLERDASLLLGEVQRDLGRLGSVEWSSIVAAKIAHTLESKLCFLCHRCCGEEHDTHAHNSFSLNGLNGLEYDEEETKEAPETGGGGSGGPRVGGTSNGHAVEFVTISNAGRTSVV